jgi:hypothetical protein
MDPISADNFVRVESEMYVGQTVKLAGGIGNFDHHYRLRERVSG